MTDDAAVVGQHGNLESEAAAGRRIGVHVAHFEAVEYPGELGDELVAERAAVAGVNEKPTLRQLSVAPVGRGSGRRGWGHRRRPEPGRD